VHTRKPVRVGKSEDTSTPVQVYHAFLHQKRGEGMDAIDFRSKAGCPHLTLAVSVQGTTISALDHHLTAKDHRLAARGHLLGARDHHLGARSDNAA